jgi:hypothetical protein
MVTSNEILVIRRELCTSDNSSSTNPTRAVTTFTVAAVFRNLSHNSLSNNGQNLESTINIV